MRIPYACFRVQFSREELLYPREEVYKGVLYSYLVWTFALLRSTVQGNAKASIGGTSNIESSTSCFYSRYTLRY